MLAKIKFYQWFLIILVTVMIGYNPTGYSLMHAWYYDAFSTPALLLITAIWFVLIGLYALATFQSIGLKGVVAVLVIIGLFIWWIYSLTAFDITNATMWQWITTICVALVLTIGWAGH